MSFVTFVALISFSIVSSITPGPNNVMLFSSGMNFGWHRTIPHALGIAFGFGVLLFAVGVGLGLLLDQYPSAILIIKILGGGYMLYLAWRIANSGPVEVGESGARPMTFFEAALFQWINPKAVVMATSAMAAYTGEGDYLLNVLVVVFVFCVLNLPCVFSWAVFGSFMRAFLQDPVKLKIFNWIMAVTLVLSLWPMLNT